MGKKELDTFFESYLKKESIFVNKKALQASYTPKNVPHREKEIKHLAGVLAPALRKEKPSNLFIYGKTGTGKTLCVKHVMDHLLSTSDKNKINLEILYLNCKLKRVADTEYRLVAQLIREFGGNVPSTGLPTDEVYKLFLKILDEKNVLLLLVLDEIDQLVSKTGDEILYNLTRINSELKNSEISIIGISNDLVFTDNLDPRVKSSLSEEELLFPPYNAIQLQKILKERSKIGFKQKIIDEGVIEKCAAYAAREHGDARRALELLRVAGELSERANSNKVTLKFIDKAEDKIEKDRVLDTIRTQPKQSKLVLSAIFGRSMKTDNPIFTGDIYDLYKEVSFKAGVRPLTQRRISDIIAELDMLGVINTKVISKGRYGRTREIRLAVPMSTIPRLKEVLDEGL